MALPHTLCWRISLIRNYLAVRSHLPYHLYELQRVVFPPRFDTICEHGGYESAAPQLLRHTDASRIVGSTTVGDQLLTRWVVYCPLDNRIWQNSDRPWDSGTVVVVTRPRPHIQDKRWAEARQSTD